MEKILDIIKEIWNVVSAILGGCFVLYAYFATIIITAQLLSEQLNINNTGLLAFIIVTAFTYLAYKKFEE